MNENIFNNTGILDTRNKHKKLITDIDYKSCIIILEFIRVFFC